MHLTIKRKANKKAAAATSTDITAASAFATAPSPPLPNPTRSQTVPLVAVPENIAPRNSSQTGIRPPPSAFRNFDRSSLGSSGSSKGKERVHEPDLPTPIRTGWAQWVVDPLEARRGSEVWSQGDRVVLILGVFIDTLLLVGSVHPLPEIEALTSPSYLMSLGSGNTIYPTIQPFQPPAAALQSLEHPLHVLLKQATVLADAHRRRNSPESAPASRPTSWASRSRRGSGTSGTMTPPGTPPQKPSRRFGSFGRSATSSAFSSPTGSSIDLSRLAASSRSSTRTPSIMSVPTERRRPLRRISSLLSGESPVSEGAPFDSVINFIPSAQGSIEPRRVFQDMLQHTVVLTTAVLPIMMTECTTNSVAATIAVPDLAPLTVLHIVPRDAPPALAPVIERFLFPLLPQIGQRTRRELFGCVTGLGPWLATSSEPSGEGLGGAETILFGGVRSTHQDGLRTSALLSTWDQCSTSNGTLVEIAQRDRESPAPFSRPASSLALAEMRHGGLTGLTSTSPPKILPKSLPPRLPHARSMPMIAVPKIRTQLDSPLSPPSPASGDNTPRAAAAHDHRQPPFGLSQSYVSTSPTGSTPRLPSGLRNTVQPALQASPPTPELDPSSSSCSSSSVLEPPPEERSVNSGASSRRLPSAPNGKALMPKSKPRGFGSLFRRSRGIKA